LEFAPVDAEYADKVKNTENKTTTFRIIKLSPQLKDPTLP
jgi:hypothetical protein